MNNTQRLLDERGAAHFLNVSLSTLRRLKAAGHLPFVRVGLRGLRFDRNDLNNFIERQRVTAKAGDHAIV